MHPLKYRMAPMIEEQLLADSNSLHGVHVASQIVKSVKDLPFTIYYAHGLEPGSFFGKSCKKRGYIVFEDEIRSSLAAKSN